MKKYRGWIINVDVSEPTDLSVTSERSSKMDFIIGVDDPPPTYAEIIEVLTPDTSTEQQRKQQQTQADHIQSTSNSSNSISTRIGISWKFFGFLYI